MNRFNDKKILNALAQAATRTATGTGIILDRQGYELVDILVQVGTSTTADASNYFTVSLTASDASDMTGEEAVTSSNGLVGANLIINATTDADKVNHIGYNGPRRYVRLAYTETGTSSVQIAAVASLELPARAQVANADLLS